MSVSNEELLAACDAMWDTDKNRVALGSATGIQFNLSGLKRSIHDAADRAAEPFFTSVNERVFQQPTFATFRALLDNYIAAVGQAETFTRDEKQEEVAFINAIFPTGPMQFCFEFLKKHNKCAADPNEFKRQLAALWFRPYRRTRGGPLDSSGFEHVFIGEVKNSEVSGLHNWIRIYDEERKQKLNYKGFFAGRRRRNESSAAAADMRVVTLQFEWNGAEKKIGSTLLGSSPEFEVALYTMCFLSGAGEEARGGGRRCLVELGDFRVYVVLFDYCNGQCIGTAYPESL
jgi:poly(U)-specific endoribonuclease